MLVARLLSNLPTETQAVNHSATTHCFNPACNVVLHATDLLLTLLLLLPAGGVGLHKGLTQAR